MRGPSTHPSLLERLAGNDAEAWREFEARYGDLLLRYGLARGLQLADAEDARQLVLLSLAKGLATFHYRPELGRFRDYLGRSVRNATFRVASRPIGPGTALSEVEVLALHDADGREEPDPLWEREWREHHLRRALGVLRKTFDPRSMQMFEQLLRGRDPSDVARLFGSTPAAVHKVKQRVRNRLREQLTRQLADEEATRP